MRWDSSECDLKMERLWMAQNSSQFFITMRAAPWLDGKFAIVGRVVQGMDVVLELDVRPPFLPAMLRPLLIVARRRNSAARRAL